MSLLAKEYAKALFEKALEGGVATPQYNHSETILEYGESLQESYLHNLIGDEAINTVQEDLNAVLIAFKENADYIKVINSPILALDVKKDLIKKAFFNLSKLTVNFLLVLLDNNRMDILEQINTEYNKQVDEYRKEMLVKVTSVIALSDEQKKALKIKLENQVKKKVKLKNIIDETLLGGLKIEIDNTITDLSIKNRLRSLEKQLLSRDA